MATAKLQLITMVVGDMQPMVDFYRRLGFDVPDGEPPWDAIHRSANLGTGDEVNFDLDVSSFAPKWADGWAGDRTGVLLTFGGDRPWVDQTHEQLTAAGAPSLQAPYDAFWGSRFAAVEDPDGNAVGLMSPPDPAHAGPPPEV